MNIRGAVIMAGAATLALPFLSSATIAPSCGISTPPRPVAPNTSARLVWYTQNATHASIGGIGQVPLQGYRDVAVPKTTMYTMTVFNGSVSRTCSAIVTVTPTMQVTAPSTVWYGSLYSAPSIIIPAQTTQTIYVPQSTTYVTNTATQYINIPTSVPVYSSYSYDGIDYGYVPDGYATPVPGEPFVNTYTDETGTAAFGCYMGWGDVANCNPEPLESYPGDATWPSTQEQSDDLWGTGITNTFPEYDYLNQSPSYNDIPSYDDTFLNNGVYYDYSEPSDNNQVWDI